MQYLSKSLLGLALLATPPIAAPVLAAPQMPGIVVPDSVPADNGHAGYFGHKILPRFKPPSRFTTTSKNDAVRSKTKSLPSSKSPSPTTTDKDSVRHSKTKTLPSFESLSPIASQTSGPISTDRDYVGHSNDPKTLANQRQMALEIITIGECEGYKACGTSAVEGKKFLSGINSQAIRNMTVSIEQVNASPITIQVNVTNNSPLPITFWKDESPLCPWAADLGFFHYHQKIRSSDFGVRLRGEAHDYRPSRLSDLVELLPYQSETAKVVIPYRDDPVGKAWLDHLKSTGPTRLSMSGNWYGIWVGSKEEIMKTDMNDDKDGFDFWNDFFLPWQAKIIGSQEEKALLSLLLKTE
ncbi:hypothetical protein FBEOM_2260 [Fusarium beomiforme]|uniref:Uncharacterized protein n=1 Tax=Fusarium beomiforme TaxID=44412 RepID=A0A9P5ARR9_9HYPO|nr:hypothetical protein FBEOM_2260 [Fusarium beomiforme]